MTFINTSILLVSKHQKQKAIGPHVSGILKAKLICCETFDTDMLGTFTGEIRRKLSPLETVKTKVKKGLLTSKYQYGIATEGSFNPHPIIPFIGQHTEIMAFYDKNKELYITESYSTSETNFNSIALHQEDSYNEFCKQARFPSHGLIIKSFYKDEPKYFKGIKTKIKLINSIKEAFEYSQGGPIHIETDMRAMMNPTRMKQIGVLAKAFVIKILTPCPRCNTKGFGERRSIKGLNCITCESPTELIKSHDTTCLTCNYTLSNPVKGLAEPKFCNYCNP